MRPSRTPDARSVTVVVPALNEAELLPILLRGLAAQTRPPDRVIVADAGSTDGTPDVARRLGATVVPGGTPPVGRNAGAAASTGDLLFFLDADVAPGPDFMERALREFAERGLEVATAAIVPVDQSLGLRVAYVLTEGYLRGISHVSPHAIGACILVTRALHERVGGFDESLALGEDHDYAKRASRLGRYGVLWAVRVPVAMRRLRKEGSARYARILVASELRTLTGRPVRRLPDGYEFGAYDPDDVRPDEGTKDAARRWRARARRAWRRAEAPSSEVQGDALGVLAAATLAGGVGAGAFAATGRRRGALRWLAGWGTVAAPAAWVWRRKRRGEHPYGTFFTAAVSRASDDVVDAGGHVVIRSGVDTICELHLVRNVRRMGELHRSGPGGRHAIRLDTIEGIQAMAADLDDPAYRGVTHLTARSYLAGELLQVGFTEVALPAFDAVNRLEKRLLAWQLGVRTGRPRRWRPDAERMVIMRVDDFRAPAAQAALAAWAERTRADLERATADTP